MAAISKWINVGAILKMNSINYPDKPGWQDKDREFTFKEWNSRACRFANGLADLGVGYKDGLAVLSHNRGEWMDMYAGCAKRVQIAVPIMFRLAAPEIEYILNHSDSKGMVVEAPFVVESKKRCVLRCAKGLQFLSPCRISDRDNGATDSV